jgi:hypothetical protein
MYLPSTTSNYNPNQTELSPYTQEDPLLQPAKIMPPTIAVVRTIDLHLFSPGVRVDSKVRAAPPAIARQDDAKQAPGPVLR